MQTLTELLDVASGGAQRVYNLAPSEISRGHAPKVIVNAEVEAFAVFLPHMNLSGRSLLVVAFHEPTMDTFFSVLDVRHGRAKQIRHLDVVVCIEAGGFKLDP